MSETPEQIQLESIEDLSDPRVLETVDYLVTGGEVYQLHVNDYADTRYLKKVDEIPMEYWQRWDDE